MIHLRVGSLQKAILDRFSRALFPFRDSLGERSPERSLGNLLSHASSFSSALHRLEKVNPREPSWSNRHSSSQERTSSVLFCSLFPWNTARFLRHVTFPCFPFSIRPSGANSLLFQIRVSRNESLSLMLIDWDQAGTDRVSYRFMQRASTRTPALSWKNHEGRTWNSADLVAMIFRLPPRGQLFLIGPYCTAFRLLLVRRQRNPDLKISHPPRHPPTN